MEPENQNPDQSPITQTNSPKTIPLNNSFIKRHIKKILIGSFGLIIIFFIIIQLLRLFTFFSGGGTITEALKCVKGGAWIGYFNNGCANRCTTNPMPLCTMALTPDCSCGTGKCWNGENCVANPPFVYPITIPTATNPQTTISPNEEFQQKNRIQGWNTYSNKDYKYTLQYPDTWTLIEDKDIDGYPRIKLTSTSATKATFSFRMLPEMYISINSPYSTSNTICNNQTCTEISPLMEIKIMGKALQIPVIKGSVGSGNVFDFYSFIFSLPDKKVILPGFSEPVDLLVIASYKNDDEKQIFSNILSTLSY